MVGRGACVCWGGCFTEESPGPHPKALDPQAGLVCPHVCWGAGHSWGAGRFCTGFSFVKFVYFLDVLGLCCCRQAFSSCRALASLQGLLLLWSADSRAAGFRGCGSWLPEHRLSSYGAQAVLLRWHVGSSQFRDPTRISCLGRQILYH